jgi:hypothetical protein
MDIQKIAREVFYKYPYGIKIWQLQEEAKYFGIDTNILFKELCKIGQRESESCPYCGGE